MNSGGTRGFTVVTILTLVFAPILQNHHWTWRLDQVKSDTHTEACVVQQPCPTNKIVVDIVKPPLPADPKHQ